MFSIVLYAPDTATANRAAKAAFERIAALELVMSDYDPQSEVSRLCQTPAGQAVPISDDLFRALELSLDAARRSEGAFDPTIGPLVQLWRQARKSHQLPSPESIAEAKSRVGWQWLKLDARKHTATLLRPRMQIDLGGNGKGFAADEAMRELKKLGVTSAMVAASGDIALGDAPPGKKGWEIGIASIDHPNQGLTGSLCLSRAAVSTSGDTEQFVEIQGRRYSHIVDPATGYGLTNRIGVTIVAPNASISDSLDTTISVMGVQKGLRLVESWRGVAALIVVLDGPEPQHLKSSRFDRFVSPSSAQKK
jgi:thiamine biosynthesis lipoprotein